VLLARVKGRGDPSSEPDPELTACVVGSSEGLMGKSTEVREGHSRIESEQTRDGVVGCGLVLWLSCSGMWSVGEVGEVRERERGNSAPQFDCRP
jgi:hypothetical protein